MHWTLPSKIIKITIFFSLDTFIAYLLFLNYWLIDCIFICLLGLFCSLEAHSYSRAHTGFEFSGAGICFGAGSFIEIILPLPVETNFLMSFHICIFHRTFGSVESEAYFCKYVFYLHYIHCDVSVRVKTSGFFLVTTDNYLKESVLFFILWKGLTVAQAGLELTSVVLLPLPKCSDYRWETPQHTASLLHQMASADCCFRSHLTYLPLTDVILTK